MTAPFGGGPYNSGNSRGTNGDPLIPQPVLAEIIAAMPQYSAIRKLAKEVPMSATTLRQPVKTQKSTAYFTNPGSNVGGGDYAPLKTTQTAYTNSELVAEDMGVIVPIPAHYIADMAAGINIWDDVQSDVSEALGLALDAACLFGVNAPATWAAQGSSIYTGAVAAGNIVQLAAFTGSDVPSPGYDYGQGIALAGSLLKKEGFSLNGFAAAPGFGWDLAALRGTTGQPVYQQNADGPDTLYGKPVGEVLNGAWNSTEAAVIAGDWSNAKLGLLQDLQYDFSKEGSYFDASSGNVYNAFQENLVLLRVTMRVGFVVTNPVTRLTPVHGEGYPFAVVHGDASLT
jgi:HK97 family phage major capsid protein